ncbi:dipeptide ABC transporter ATP-binding protein [Microcella sp.]|uniref:dipeptide ABC transporter ATP-binding protein n=1 Tax=Microcella sp. TaxID=1913979 RepID=UPI003F70B4D8
MASAIVAESGRHPVLRIRDLRVGFDVDGSHEVAVDGIDIDVAADEVVALVGESGSGKSVTAMSVLGLLPRNAQVSGSVQLEGRELVGLSPRELRHVRGQGVAMIFQDPVAALDPVFTVGYQLVEAIRAHRLIPRRQARARALELLRAVELPDPERRLGFYPHQLSGGQAQRVVIAIALAAEPRLLIADEPTTALDVTVQAEVLEVLRGVRERLGTGILLITHDMGVVADLADRVAVMRKGTIVQTGTAEDIFHRPDPGYTTQLLDAVLRIGDRPAVESAVEVRGPVLEIDHLVVEFGSRLRGHVRAVNDVTVSIARGEVLGLVGESGSGKTTIARSVIGIAPITSGAVRVSGVDIATARRADLMAARRRIGVVFQNPASSVNPRATIAQIVAEPLTVIGGLRGSELHDRVDELLTSVDLGGGEWRRRYPHELSGGQRQRVAIARAVALDPDLLIADEPTSALDVSVQARVLDVFRELQERLGFACLFISHDLAVVDVVCDRVGVLFHGELVELGDRSQILRDPQQPYTRRLLAAAPVPDPVLQRRRREERIGV